MYNEERKKRFIEKREQEIVITKNYLACQFKKTAKLETELHKDICDFTYYEIIDYYKMLSLKNIDSLRVMNSHFSVYTSWCLQQSLVADGQNHYMEVKDEDLWKCVSESIIEMCIIDRDTIIQFTNQLNNPRDQFLLLGLYEGISRENDYQEFLKLRPCDVNGNMLTLCTGRQITVSDKLISIIEDCITTDEYCPRNGESEDYWQLVDRGFVFKHFKNVQEDSSDYQIGRRVYSSLKRIFKYLDLFYGHSATTISDSGKIEMIRLRSKELNMTCEDYIYSDKWQEVKTQYNIKIRYYNKNFYKKYQKYLVS